MTVLGSVVAPDPGMAGSTSHRPNVLANTEPSRSRPHGKGPVLPELVRPPRRSPVLDGVNDLWQLREFPQTRGLKTTDASSRAVLEATGPQSVLLGQGQGVAGLCPLQRLEGRLSPPPCPAGARWHPWLWQHSHGLHGHVAVCWLCHIFLRLALTRTPTMAFGVHRDSPGESRDPSLSFTRSIPPPSELQD